MLACAFLFAFTHFHTLNRLFMHCTGKIFTQLCDSFFFGGTPNATISYVWGDTFFYLPIRVKIAAYCIPTTFYLFFQRNVGTFLLPTQVKTILGHILFRNKIVHNYIFLSTQITENAFKMPGIKNLPPPDTTKQMLHFFTRK